MANQQETTIEAIRTRLATITAGVNGAVYTPVVKRTSFFEEQVDLDPTVPVVYLLRPGQETRRLSPDACRIYAELEVFLLVAQRFVEPTENPYQSNPVRWQMAADMVFDATVALYGDATAAGSARDMRDFVVDYERYLPTWAMAEIRFTCWYSYDRFGRA